MSDEGFTHIREGKVSMVDITEKEVVYRMARAEGFIRLSSETLRAIRENRVAKGDVLVTANIAAIMAVKRTSELIPMCHPLPLTHVNVDFEIVENGIKAVCEVRCSARTGVEMEALTGVAVALLTVWDMVKSMEKVDGQYPNTAIEGIRVVEKVKKRANIEENGR